MKLDTNFSKEASVQTRVQIVIEDFIVSSKQNHSSKI